MGLYTFHCFAGAGGGLLCDLMLGHTPIGAVEIEEYPRKVLLQRQLDGILPVFPIWDDVTTFSTENSATRDFIYQLKDVSNKLVICGGFPCQDISSGGNGAGLDGERSGLWREMARIVCEVRPCYVFVENSPMLTSRGLGRVLGDLAEMGYDAKWGVLGAGHVGAWHLRERIWVVATDDNQIGLQRDSKQKIYREFAIPWNQNVRRFEDLQGRPGIPQSLVCRVRDGVADKLDISYAVM